MNGLTKRQRQIYEYVHDYIAQKGYSPSFREIGTHFRYSSLGTVQRHVAALKRKGVLSATPAAKRSLTICPGAFQVDPAAQVVYLPFVGQLSEEATIDTFEQIQSLSIPAILVRNPSNSYVLRARGQIWRQECIADGDLVIIEINREPEAGETVVAKVQGRIMIYKFIASAEETAWSAAQVEVQGVVVGVIRLY